MVDDVSFSCWLDVNPDVQVLCTRDAWELYLEKVKCRVQAELKDFMERES